MFCQCTSCSNNGWGAFVWLSFRHTELMGSVAWAGRGKEKPLGTNPLPRSDLMLGLCPDMWRRSSMVARECQLAPPTGCCTRYHPSGQNTPISSWKYAASPMEILPLKVFAMFSRPHFQLWLYTLHHVTWPQLHVWLKSKYWTAWHSRLVKRAIHLCGSLITEPLVYTTCSVSELF